jgi:phosphatidylglycerophosphatase A
MNTPKNSRRPLHWEKVVTFSDRLAIIAGTFFGSGLLPKAPGTWGTLAAMPVAYYLNQSELLGFKLTAWIFLLFAGVWAGKKFQELFGHADNQNIVMDEVVGLGITAWTAGDDLITYAACFIAFRFFDILKVPPVRQLDRWSKNATSAWMSGLGVMIDDVIAGFQALFVILMLQHFGILG